MPAFQRIQLQYLNELFCQHGLQYANYILAEIKPLPKSVTWPLH